MTYVMHASNFAGDPLYKRLGLDASGTLQSLWYLTGSVAIKPAVVTDRRTRGGPIIETPREWEAEASISTDGRKPVVGSVEVAYENWSKGGYEGSWSASAILRPAPSLQVSVAPRLSLVRDESQYIRTVADSLSPTFANRYVFATLRQRTMSLNLRGDWTLSPTLSLQLFSQPFTASARFDNYKELRAPRSFDFNVYGRHAGTTEDLGEGRVRIDPDGMGPASPFVLGDRSNEASFVTRALRVNAVLRWEYRGGSTIYLVWQQTRDGESLLGDSGLDGLHRVLDEPSRNVIHLKASYRIGR